MKIKSVLFKMLDSRNSEIELHLALLGLGALTIVGLSVYQVVVLSLPFDPSSFGQGLGFLLAGGGAAAFGQGYQRMKQRDMGHERYK